MKERVLEILRNTKTEEEWNSICDVIKAMRGQMYQGDYPEWWFREVLVGGVAYEATQNWERYKATKE